MKNKMITLFVFVLITILLISFVSSEQVILNKDLTNDDVQFPAVILGDRLGAITLDELFDVDVPSPSNNEVLSFSTALNQWINAPIIYVGVVNNSNSSNFWDDLNTPLDIVGSIFWYNHTLNTYNNWNNKWTSTYNESYNSKITDNASWNETNAEGLFAKYNFTTNDFNGSGNFKTTGNISAYSLNITENSTFNGGLVVNEIGGNYSFRVESDTNPYLISTNASRGTVSFGTQTVQDMNIYTKVELNFDINGLMGYSAWNSNQGNKSGARFLAHNSGAVTAVEMIGQQYNGTGTRQKNHGILITSGSGLHLGTLIGNAPIRFYTGGLDAENLRLMIDWTGDLKFLTDTRKMFFGLGDDASIMYDGTNMIINPKEVGSGVLNILGTVNISEGLNVTGNVSANSYKSNDKIGISGNFTNGNCWMAFEGGILYSTNCSLS